MNRLFPILLCAGLAACGQQHEPETTSGRAPAASVPTPPAGAPAQQVGMSPTAQDGAAGNPTGRGERGDAGRGQGPAPGQTGSSIPVADAREVTQEQAQADCARLAEPQRQECLDTLDRGEAIDARRDADDGE